MPKYNSLRAAIELLKKVPGQYMETDVPVKPHAEISGIYRYVGAGGTVKRPTKQGPALMFNQVTGHEDARVLIGLLASRERVGLLLGEKPERLGFLLKEAVEHPIRPVVISNAEADCQEVKHFAAEEGFDIRKILPAPTNTPEDAGPYITMGMCYASDVETGESDITIHRLCLQSEDTISMYFVPGARHLGAFREKAEALGRPLPISISIGVDPAIEIAACFEPPTTPIGFNELSVAGAIRNSAVRLTNCLTIEEKCIANAEYVIEGELIPDSYIREDINTNTGKAMPEFPGYTGNANQAVPLIKVKAVTHRENPIMQTCIGPSEEHVNMAGIPTEASIIQMVERAMPGRLQNVYCCSAGGGKYMAVLQFKKRTQSDEGRQRQAALLAFSAFSELKHIFIVDEDVDPFDMNDVLFAMNTRYQGDIDTIFIPGVRCHPLDPSQKMEYNLALRDNGISCKMIFDCTVPYAQKKRFERSKFLEVDYRKWCPEL
ncbi:3,4-dihydroxybenzoate decarboxylase [Lactonifactor longoviformis]|uniref:4-hydroxy-3-polyprenylbenzoate decarboxylase n=1 Tax=Lactonifactor longoviformis DSM 17459 TaxID=1122155 RepID=A0A1M5AC40_9CLOT|nr:UbiD family decarboxylase [Lactonifactor longoviformis]POP31929.1 3,4-dihydroxybenzoate decarboxylase [Lactonifactor longoviformis]SHF27891.1 4-hydroxy-3-polyprenylbenzoate decarboxylase [Lactonifactor longoviformis DSM 17459]